MKISRVTGTERIPRRRVRFADEVEEEEWSSMLRRRFGIPGFGNGRVDSGFESKV